MEKLIKIKILLTDVTCFILTVEVHKNLRLDFSFTVNFLAKYSGSYGIYSVEQNDLHLVAFAFFIDFSRLFSTES
jgi:hypothetical protein